MNPEFGYRAIGFLDQDPYKIGRQIHGIRILGSPEHLETDPEAEPRGWVGDHRR